MIIEIAAWQIYTAQYSRNAEYCEGMNLGENAGVLKKHNITLQTNYHVNRPSPKLCACKHCLCIGESSQEHSLGDVRLSR